jgi:hypothetical protein
MMPDLPQGGYGNWKAFDRSIDEIAGAAERWRALVYPLEKPWLVWHVSPRWTRLQQRLILYAGWTPVVGGDPRAGTPPLEPGAVRVDFNAGFNYPLMMFYFPLEFFFLFGSSKLAFWHSDLLCRLSVLEKLSATFEKLKDGELAAVHALGSWKNVFFPHKQRFWDLVGCTTVRASKDQFERGAGWWMNFAYHVNCPGEDERNKRKKWYWDHGTGIMYWSRRYGGRVIPLNEREVSEGHCTSIGNPQYDWGNGSTKNKTLPSALDRNYNIEKVARTLGIERFLD